MEPAVIEEALEGLRSGLSVDGFDLRLGQITADSDVEVVLEALPTACLDCLVPEGTMLKILDTAIRKREPRLGRVSLVHVGFEDAQEH